MNITNIRFFRSTQADNPKFKGSATITLDDEFAVHNIGIVESENGEMFLAMPDRRSRNGNYVDVFHPISREARDQLQAEVLEAFQKFEEEEKEAELAEAAE